MQGFIIVLLAIVLATSMWWLGWKQREEQGWAQHDDAPPPVSLPPPLPQDLNHLITTLVEAIPRPVLLTTADRIVLDANQAALQLVGQPRERVLGRVVASIVQNYETTQLLIAAAKSGVAQEHTISRIHDGETWHVAVKPLNLAIGEQNAPSQVSHLLLFIDDETRLRYLETVRRDFVASVSHELRTPLASVKLMAETVADALETDPAVAQSLAGHISLEVDHLTALVDDLLDLSRIESGRINLELEPTDIGGVLEVAADRMRQLAEERGIGIWAQIPATIPEVQVDGERIGQVLVSLIHNAIKFTPAGGSITLSAECSTTDAVRHELLTAPAVGTMPPLQISQPVVVVHVRDSGIGIVEEDLPRIFERFFKARDLQLRGPQQRSITERPPGTHGGTGLGLAIARHIVEAQNGQIWAVSSLGRGSTFSFSLPLASRTPAALAAD